MFLDLTPFINYTCLPTGRLVRAAGVGYKFSLAVARSTRSPPLTTSPAGSASLRVSIPVVNEAVHLLHPSLEDSFGLPGIERHSFSTLIGYFISLRS